MVSRDWSAHLAGCANVKFIFQVNTSDEESVRSHQPTINIDLPDYAGSECSPDLRHRNKEMVSWESPVLGESVSMYEQQQHQDVEDAYHNIMSKVNQLLGEPLPTTCQSPATPGLFPFNRNRYFYADGLKGI